MNTTNKEKVAALLKSIETRVLEPIHYIDEFKYIQHNPAVEDGRKGFIAYLRQLPINSVTVNTVRMFQDGNYVIAHSEYNLWGPKICFDVFRFEKDLIVEHWDNSQDIVSKTKSGRGMIDGPTEVVDRDKTIQNRVIVDMFVYDVLLGNNPFKIKSYISSDGYCQHDPFVGDGLTGFSNTFSEPKTVGTTMKYEVNHKILCEGNFALSISSGTYHKEDVTYYDLFRLECNKIAEHWDVIETLPPRHTWKNANGKI